MINLSISLVSIGFINPIITKAEINDSVLISIFLLVILALVMIIYSVKLLK